MHLLTVRSYYWRRLKVLSWLIFWSFQAAQAQSWVEVKRETFDANIAAISTDFQDNIYLALADDQLIKLDKMGKEIANFSQPNLGPVTSLETQNNLNPFFFVRDNQQVVFLDRFLANPVVYDLSQWTSSFVWLATPSVDRQMLLLESDPFRITKVDRFTGNVLHEIFLQIGLETEDLTYFVARQQQLILVDPFKGIYIFDLFGNLVKFVAVEDATSVQLQGSQLFYFAAGSSFQLDLNTGLKTEFPVPDLCERTYRIEDLFLCLGVEELKWWELSDQ